MRRERRAAIPVQIRSAAWGATLVDARRSPSIDTQNRMISNPETALWQGRQCNIRVVHRRLHGDSPGITPEPFASSTVEHRR